MDNRLIAAIFSSRAASSSPKVASIPPASYGPTNARATSTANRIRFSTSSPTLSNLRSKLSTSLPMGRSCSSSSLTRLSTATGSGVSPLTWLGPPPIAAWRRAGPGGRCAVSSGPSTRPPLILPGRSTRMWIGLPTGTPSSSAASLTYRSRVLGVRGAWRPGGCHARLASASRAAAATSAAGRGASVAGATPPATSPSTTLSTSISLGGRLLASATAPISAWSASAPSPSSDGRVESDASEGDVDTELTWSS